MMDRMFVIVVPMFAGVIMIAHQFVSGMSVFVGMLMSVFMGMLVGVFMGMLVGVFMSVNLPS